jgi:hypothetical protein
MKIVWITYLGELTSFTLVEYIIFCKNLKLFIKIDAFVIIKKGEIVGTMLVLQRLSHEF